MFFTIIKWWNNRRLRLLVLSEKVDATSEFSTEPCVTRYVWLWVQARRQFDQKHVEKTKFNMHIDSELTFWSDFLIMFILKRASCFRCIDCFIFTQRRHAQMHNESQSIEMLWHIFGDTQFTWKIWCENGSNANMSAAQKKGEKLRWRMRRRWRHRSDCVCNVHN